MSIASRLQTIVAAALLTALFVSHRAMGAPRAVAIVLDCSSSMSAPMPASPSETEPTSTRLDVAKDVLQAALTKFSEHPDCQAAVWLFGHRLAWEDGDTPALREQTAYLEQTLGFEVLKELMPGDDVELVRPLGVFEPEHVEMLTVRLENVKPWGEDPLYLCLVRCLDNLPSAGLPADAAVLVITDGGNRQGLAKHPTRRSAVIEAYGRNELPLHFVLIGDGKNDRQVEAEFKQLANRTGGDFTRATDGEALARALESALKVDRPPEIETAVADDLEDEDDADDEDDKELAAHEEDDAHEEEDKELADEPDNDLAANQAANDRDDNDEPLESDDQKLLADDRESKAKPARAVVPARPKSPAGKARTGNFAPTLLDESEATEAQAADESEEPAEAGEAIDASSDDPTDEADDLEDEPVPPRRKSARAKPRRRVAQARESRGIRLQGLVTFYGKPVKKAKVKLVDSDAEPVVTGPDGRFEFRDLPEGSYTLSCEAVVRNVVRAGAAPVRLSAKTRGTKAVDVKLE